MLVGQNERCPTCGHAPHGTEQCTEQLDPAHSFDGRCACHPRARRVPIVSDVVAREANIIALASLIMAYR
mgnify:FL=1